MFGWVAQFKMKCCKQSIQHLARNDDKFTGWSEWHVVPNDDHAIASQCRRRKYRLTSLTLVSFFEGRVPCLRWALTRRKSRHSDCAESHADLLVNGRRITPVVTSSTETFVTTDCSRRDMKEHI